MGSTSMLAACMAAHLLVAELVPSPWWVPNLTLVGLVLAIERIPCNWLLLSGASGLFTMAWAVRFPIQVFVSYLACGWAVYLFVRHWDTDDLRVQCLAVAVASAAMAVEMLWLDDLWSFPMVGLVGLHATVTALSVPMMQRLLQQVPPFTETSEC
jgi:hypothetical protein